MIYIDANAMCVSLGSSRTTLLYEGGRRIVLTLKLSTRCHDILFIVERGAACVTAVRAWIINANHED